jgi:hypothetical protein
VDLKNHTVNFRICDVFHPECTQVLFKLHGNDVLHGRVLEVTSDSSSHELYVIVELEEDEGQVIVPVDRILGISE